VTGDATRFQRARSEEQREMRRQAILATAVTMLGEMPVAKLSLNELSRRVGLAKSNVLRYFETREAVLLELLAAAQRDWLERVGTGLGPPDPGAPVKARYEKVADVVAGAMIADPLLCELLSASAAVLEQNISLEVAHRFKLAAMETIDTLGAHVRRWVPELGAQGAFNFSAGTLLATAGAWPQTNPTEAVRCAYDDPALARLRIDFDAVLREMLATLLAGCLVRWPDGGNGPNGANRPGTEVGLPDRSGTPT
jgi:AcrR family transcriptional regulator